jgi:hypothetical protein
MADGIVFLQLHRNEEDADERIGRLLAALGTALGSDKPLEPNHGNDAVMLPVPNLDETRELIVRTLKETDDDHWRYVVLRSPG